MLIVSRIHFLLQFWYLYKVVDLLINIGLLAIGAVILVKSATLLVTAISSISRYLKLSEFTTAFIIMGVITSIPELAVGISSGLEGNPTLALGTALGSNITDLTLVIAIPIILAGGIRVRSLITRKDALLMSVYAFIPFAMLFDGSISRLDGVVLIIFYGLYIVRLASQRTYFSKHENHIKKHEAIKQLIIFVLAVIALFASSELVVNASAGIAIDLNIPIILVGLVVVSTGTSLPELAHGLKAVSTHHNRQILGDVMGSVVANSSLVIGVTAIISPIPALNFDEVVITILILALVIMMFIFGVYNDKHLTIKEALILLSIYIFFLLSEFAVEFIHLAMK